MEPLELLLGIMVLLNVIFLLGYLRALRNHRRFARDIADHVDRSALRRFDSEFVPDLRGSCTVVIPAFNEAGSLPGVLGSMPAEVLGLRVTPIVVADGCTDETEHVARNLGAWVISRDLRRGQGAAVRLGYLVALRHEASVIVTMDADGQHDPGELRRLVRPLLVDEADLVQGSRILGTFESDSDIRARGVAFFAHVLTRLGGTRVTDPSNGYRAALPKALRCLDLRQDQFFSSELIVDAIRKNLRLAEVPVTVRRRTAGESKKGTDLRYAWGFTKTLCVTWVRDGFKKSDQGDPRWLRHRLPERQDHDSMPESAEILPIESSGSRSIEARP